MATQQTQPNETQSGKNVFLVVAGFILGTIALLFLLKYLLNM